MSAAALRKGCLQRLTSRFYRTVLPDYRTAVCRIHAVGTPRSKCISRTSDDETPSSVTSYLKAVAPASTCRQSWSTHETKPHVSRRQFCSVPCRLSRKSKDDVLTGSDGGIEQNDVEAHVEDIAVPLNEKEGNWKRSTYSLQIGGNGSIDLEVFSLGPRVQSARTTRNIHESKHNAARLGIEDMKDERSRTKDILMYLPSGVPLSQTASFHQVLDDWLESSSRRYSTVVRVKYRIGPASKSDDSKDDHRFPTPIHDVAMSFAWIKENGKKICQEGEMRHELNEYSLHSEDGGEPQIAIYGSHIGGSLALMLALTQPNDIHAVTVHDPIVDWTSLDELSTPAVPQPEPRLGLEAGLTWPNEELFLSGYAKLEGASGKESDARDKSVKQQKISKRQLKSDLATLQGQSRAGAAKALLDLRTKLFRTPSAYFDPFASPVLFLRSPGKDTPRWRTALPEPDPEPEFAAMNHSNKNAMSTELEKTRNDEKADLVAEGVGVDMFHAGDDGQPPRLQDFGPYDDDWHTVSESETHGSDTSGSDLLTSSSDEFTSDDLLDTNQSGVSSIGSTDRSPYSNTVMDEVAGTPTREGFPSAETVVADSSSLPPVLPATTSRTPTTVSDEVARPKPATSKRRKVVRRWPPTGWPEDVMLPYISILSTRQASLAPHTLLAVSLDDFSQADFNQILHPQATEMVDLIERACFWGRDRAWIEERVKLFVLNRRDKTEVGSGDRFDDSGSTPHLREPEDSIRKSLEWTKDKLEGM